MVWGAELDADAKNATMPPDGVTQWFTPPEGVWLDTVATTPALARRARQLGGVMMQADPIQVENCVPGGWIPVPVKAIVAALRTIDDDRMKKSQAQYWQGAFDATLPNKSNPHGPTVDFSGDQGTMFSRLPEDYFKRSSTD